MKSLTPVVVIVLFFAAAAYITFANWSEPEETTVPEAAALPEASPAPVAEGTPVAAMQVGTSGPGDVVPAAADHDHAPSPAVMGPPLQLTGQPDEPIASNPNSWFEATDLKLGTFYQYEKAHGVFRFKNPSDQTRRFSNIGHTCTCTGSSFKVGGREYYVEATADQAHQLFRVVERNGIKNPERVDHISIGPGEEGIIEVEMEMQGTQGLKAAAVNLTTDDPELPSIRLTFEAFGAAYFSIVPQEVNLNTMNWDDVRTFEVKVSSSVFGDFEITKVDALPAGMKVEYVRSVVNGVPTYTISGTYGPVDSGATSGGSLVFRTDQKDLSFTINVIAFVQGPLTMEPSGFVALGRIRKDTSASKTINIIPSGGFDLQVEKLEWKELSFDEEFLEVTSAKNDSGVVEVTVRILAGIPAGTIVRGEVLVHLNHPAARSESILFNGFVR